MYLSALKLLRRKMIKPSPIDRFHFYGQAPSRAELAKS
ncbi:hypothetical protein AA98_3174 [Escherichia coli 2-011-08_S1_C1]|nr:hypothetical protein AA98_3174 [Escherichia coli 2-011-08_S1_C1]